MNIYIKNLIFWQLLIYGIHIGHSFKNSTIFAGWFIYTYKQKTWIINLYKTVNYFKDGYIALDAACKTRSSI